MHDRETARKQCEFERANQEELSAFIKDQGLADVSELVDYRTADCFMTKETWEKGLASYRGLEKVGGNVTGIKILDADEARKVRSTGPTREYSNLDRHCELIVREQLLMRLAVCGPTNW